MDYEKKIETLEVVLRKCKEKLESLKKLRGNLDSLENECNRLFPFKNVEEYINEIEMRIKDSNLTLRGAIDELKGKKESWRKLINQKKEHLEKTCGGAKGTEAYKNELKGHLTNKCEIPSKDTSTKIDDFVKQVDSEKTTFDNSLKEQKTNYLDSTDIKDDLNIFKSYNLNNDIDSRISNYETVKEFRDYIDGIITEDKGKLSAKKGEEYIRIIEIAQNDIIYNLDENGNIKENIPIYKVSYEEFKEMLDDRLKEARNKKIDEAINLWKVKGIDIDPKPYYKQVIEGKALNDILDSIQTDASNDLKSQKRKYWESQLKTIRNLKIEEKPFEDDIENDAVLPEVFKQKVLKAIEDAKKQRAGSKRAKYDEEIKRIGGGKIDGLDEVKPGDSPDTETEDEYAGRLKIKVDQLVAKQQELQAQIDDLKKQFEETIEAIRGLDSCSLGTFEQQARHIFDGEYDNDVKKLDEKTKELEKLMNDVTTEIIEETK